MSNKNTVSFIKWTYIIEKKENQLLRLKNLVSIVDSNVNKKEMKECLNHKEDQKSKKNKVEKKKKKNVTKEFVHRAMEQSTKHYMELV